VVINQNLAIYTPNSQYARLNTQGAQFHAKPMDIIIAPYNDPTHAWNTLLPQINRRNQQNAIPVTTPIQMLEPPQPVGNNSAGGNLLTCTLYTLGPCGQSGIAAGQGANVYYAFDRTEHGTTTHFRARGRFETAMMDQDSWGLFVNVVLAPDSTFDQDQDLMQTVINSEKFNSQAAQDAVAKRAQEMNKATGQFRASNIAFNNGMAQLAREQQTMIQNFQQKEISTIQGVTAARDLGVNRAVDDTSEFLRDPASMVLNKSSGEYFNTHMADAQAAADSLNAREGGNDWQYVPLKDRLDPATGTPSF
jgi:hypothetical protein